DPSLRGPKPRHTGPGSHRGRVRRRSSAARGQSPLPNELPELQWADTQRWRYAHPHSAASLEAVKPGAELGLFFAGDAFIGKGRIARAVETGLAAAKHINQFLGVG
ncbi:MAG: FAD-dependent oxidoreductase, partial [Verrucomicrobiota bacterium]